MNHIAKSGLSKILAVCILATALAVSAVDAGAATKNQAPSPQSGTYDAWLTGQVHHELVMIPWLSVFDNLEYRVQGTTVVLSGQVTQPVIKSEAESAVKHIEGVQEVDNQIQVLPLSPFDQRIRFDELRAIYSYPTLNHYSAGTMPGIHIVVDNGHVTLEGVVDSQADKNTAGIRANGVPDVFSVTNNLRVQKE
jgi:hyperosmotically inducible periplasmic protein